ncbi:MAG: energy transducer TonB [Gammaproteobacteria bacterium]
MLTDFTPADPTPSFFSSTARLRARICWALLALGAAGAGSANAAGTAATAESRRLAPACSAPAFPVHWQEAGDSGTVMLEVLVAPSGKVLASRLVESSGISRVDRASLKASEACQFDPDASAATVTPNWSRVQYTWVLE